MSKITTAQIRLAWRHLVATVKGFWWHKYYQYMPAKTLRLKVLDREVIINPSVFRLTASAPNELLVMVTPRSIYATPSFAKLSQKSQEFLVKRSLMAHEPEWVAKRRSEYVIAAEVSLDNAARKALGMTKRELLSVLYEIMPNQHKLYAWEHQMRLQKWEETVQFGNLNAV